MDKIRVYAIPGTEDIHEIEDEDFINQAEDLGYVWSLLGFQNELNCEGDSHHPLWSVQGFMAKTENLHFRFKNVGDYNNE